MGYLRAVIFLYQGGGTEGQEFGEILCLLNTWTLLNGGWCWKMIVWQSAVLKRLSSSWLCQIDWWTEGKIYLNGNNCSPCPEILAYMTRCILQKFPAVVALCYYFAKHCSSSFEILTSLTSLTAWSKKCLLNRANYYNESTKIVWQCR